MIFIHKWYYTQRLTNEWPQDGGTEVVINLIEYIKNIDKKYKNNLKNAVTKTIQTLSYSKPMIIENNKQRTTFHKFQMNII